MHASVVLIEHVLILPSVQTIKAHVYHAEHIKKLKLVSVVDKTDPFWCSVSINSGRRNGGVKGSYEIPGHMPSNGSPI